MVTLEGELRGREGGRRFVKIVLFPSQIHRLISPQDIIPPQQPAVQTSTNMKFPDFLILALASVGAAVPSPDPSPEPQVPGHPATLKREPLWGLGDSPLPPARKHDPGTRQA
jgi:hypothetical protein